MFYQCFGIFPILRVTGYAYAGGNIDRILPQHKGHGNFTGNFFHEDSDFFLGGDVFQRHHKLIPTQTRHQIAAAHQLQQARGHLHQQTHRLFDAPGYHSPA